MGEVWEHPTVRIIRAFLRTDPGPEGLVDSWDQYADLGFHTPA